VPEPVATAQEPTTAGVAAASAAVRVQVVAEAVSSSVVPGITVHDSGVAPHTVAVGDDPVEGMYPGLHSTVTLKPLG